MREDWGELVAHVQSERDKKMTASRVRCSSCKREKTTGEFSEDELGEEFPQCRVCLARKEVRLRKRKMEERAKIDPEVVEAMEALWERTWDLLPAESEGVPDPVESALLCVEHAVNGMRTDRSRR